MPRISGHIDGCVIRADTLRVIKQHHWIRGVRQQLGIGMCTVQTILVVCAIFCRPQQHSHTTFLHDNCI